MRYLFPQNPCRPILLDQRKSFIAAVRRVRTHSHPAERLSVRFNKFILQRSIISVNTEMIDRFKKQSTCRWHITTVFLPGTFTSKGTGMFQVGATLRGCPDLRCRLRVNRTLAFPVSGCHPGQPHKTTAIAL
jgi:hypothetical protein